MSTRKEFHEWEATHTGWILLCPIFLADIEEDAPVPIPRYGLWRWYDFNLWLNDHVNVVLGFINPEWVGYVFWNLRKLREPITVRVPAPEVP